MSNAESFLARWSRLKQVERPPPPEPPAPKEPVSGGTEPETLPPLESLNAFSDYTAFLRPSVPAGLQIEALRRAWTSDPVIAEFRGLADYDWDFNAPGYGLLQAADDVVKLTQAVFAALEPAPAATDDTADPDREVPPTPDRPSPPAGPGLGWEGPAPDVSDPEPALPRRRHGGALPV